MKQKLYSNSSKLIKKNGIKKKKRNRICACLAHFGDRFTDDLLLDNFYKAASKKMSLLILTVMTYVVTYIEVLYYII